MLAYRHGAAWLGGDSACATRKLGRVALTAMAACALFVGLHGRSAAADVAAGAGCANAYVPCVFRPIMRGRLPDNQGGFMRGSGFVSAPASGDMAGVTSTAVGVTLYSNTYGAVCIIIEKEIFGAW